MKLRRNRLEWDALETRSLLSVFPGNIHAHLHAQFKAVPVHIASHARGTVHSQAALTPVTGGGLVNVPPAPSYSDVTSIQNATSDNNLVLFLTQFEALSGSSATTQQTALSILNDANNVDLALNGFAGSIAVTIPPNIAGNSAIVAQQMIAGVRSGSTDQTFSSLIVQAETNEVNQFQQMATGAQDPSIRSFAAGILPTLQADLAAAQGTITLPLASNTASSATLSSTDLNTLATYYSINIMERFLGQLTTFVTTRDSVALYSEKLIDDHEGANVELGAYAASTQTYVPAAMSAGNVPMADMVINAINSVHGQNSHRYNVVYLQQMIMGHTQALKFSAGVIATTTNPTLKQFAQNVFSTVWMHRLAAQTVIHS